MLLLAFILVFLTGGTFAGNVCFSSIGRSIGRSTYYYDNMPLDTWSGSSCLGVPGKMLTQCGMRYTYNWIGDIAGALPLICTNGDIACWQFVTLHGPALEINYYYANQQWRLNTNRGKVSNIAHMMQSYPGGFITTGISMTVETDDCWNVLADPTYPPVPPPDPPSKGCYDGVYGLGQHNGAWGHCCKDSNDCRWSCRYGSCGTSDQPGRSCTPGYEDDEEHNGPEGACCSGRSDCISYVCDNGACTKPSTSNCHRELGEGDGYGGDCCGDEEDCREECKGGFCTGPTKPKPPPVVKPGTGSCTTGWCGKGLGKGPTGACCSVEGDCDDTCNGDGKCGEDDGTWRGPLDCNRGTKPTTTTTTKAPTPTPKYCKSGYYSKGLRNAPQGYCCKSPADCQGNCVGGMCDKPNPTPTPTPTTVPGKTCKGGFYRSKLKGGPDGYCCETNADCVGNCVFVPGDSYMCANGTTVPTPTCIPGMENISDGESEQGYCCVTSTDCMGDCINGVCGAPAVYPSPQPSSPRCTFGGWGYSNGNLPIGYCCYKDDDCMYGNCLGGICNDGSGSSCSSPKTTTTTTTATRTQPSKPTPTSVDFTKIRFPPVCVGCVFPIPVFGDFILKFGGFFGGLLGGHDDDDDSKDDDNEDTKDPENIPSLQPPPIIFTFVPLVNTTTKSNSVTSTVFSSTSTSGNTITSSLTTSGTTTVLPTTSVTSIIEHTTNSTVTPTATNGGSATTFTTSSSVVVPVTTTTNSSVVVPVTTTTNSSVVVPVTTTTSSSVVVPVTTTTSSSVVVPVTTTSTSTKSVTSSTSVATTTVPIGKTCKSGYFKKNLKSGPDGSCCSTSGDCVGDCVFVPGDSYMCKNGSMTTSSSVVTTPGPTPTCITGHCGKGLGEGPTGACCSTEADCKDTCNANGKCGVSDETWTKKLPCP